MTRNDNPERELAETQAYWDHLDDWDGKAIARAAEWDDEEPCS